MKPALRISSVIFMGVVAGFIFSGCGVTTKKLDDAEKRISSLTQKGMPDSLLTDVRVLLVQIKTAKQYGGGASPQRLYDSAMAILSKSEMKYSGDVNQIKPAVESMRKTFDVKKQNLTGAQLSEANRLINDVDSSIIKNKWAEAKEKCESVDKSLISLANDEKVAADTKVKLIGNWTGAQKTKNREEKADFVEKKSFSFSPDGKINIVEERNGQTNAGLKEDWKFQSGGTYSLKGDTILVAVTKEKCFKQTYMNLVEKNGKSQWIKKDKPGYDSTITSGKKDRFLTFDFLKQNFKKR